MIKQFRLALSLNAPSIDRQKLVVAGILLLAGITHAINMLGFPFYDNAEGTNAASAWALIEHGSLSPYTYSYENPPLGSLVLTIWTVLTSIVPASDAILSSGRVLMLIVHMLIALTIYGIARKLDLSVLFSIVAVVIFSLSPLTIVIQRRVLVENMMTLGVLLAFYLVLGYKRTLTHYGFSAIALGLAFLTDETALLFVPGVLYIILKRSHIWHRRFALVTWTGIALSLILAFPLYAQLKFELFPTGFPLGGSHPHVSLVESQSTQHERVAPEDLLRSDSSFAENVKNWLDSNEDTSDVAFMVVGFLSAIAILIAAFWVEWVRPLALLLIFYMVHLITLLRVFDTNIMPLLPLFAMSIGVVLQTGAVLLHKHVTDKTTRYGLYAVVAIPLFIVFTATYIQRSEIYSVNQVEEQIRATDWLRTHADFESVIVTDNYAFVDLRETIPNTHYYWTVDNDPEVRNEVLQDNWCNIDFVLTTPQMLEDMDANRLRLIETAYINSTLLRSYENNGWPIEIREVNKRNCNIPFQ